MKIKLVIALSCASLLFGSCTHVFYPATYHQDVSYMPTPTSFDSAKNATYISGGLGLGTNANITDQQISAQLNLSRGHKFKNFDLAYGVFSVAGDYNNQNIDKGKPDYFTDKFYGAVGGRIAANYVINTPKADIRVIGFEAAYSHEFGSYADFRTNLYNNPQENYYVDPRTNLFTVGLTSEVIFHKYSGSLVQHGVSVFLGETVGHNILDGTYYNGSDDTFSNRVFRNIYFKAGYFVKYKNLFAIAEVGMIQVNVKLGFAF